MNAVFDPYSTGVLKPEIHDRLVAGLDRYVRQAGIQKEFVQLPLQETCGPKECDYVRRFKFHPGEEVYGLLYTRSTPDADPETRMQAIAGCLLRNFVDARVMTLTTVLDLISDYTPPRPTCLLIPNFCSGKPSKTDTGVPKWRAAEMYDLLLKRGIQGKQTVLYVNSLDDVATVYGDETARILRNRYTHVGI